ncbi:MAG: hypothetical protein AAF990_21085 [Bacteroidota bacterium]
MEKGWADYISYISMYSIFLPVLIGLFRLKQLLGIQKLVGLLVLTSLLAETGIYLLTVWDISNLPLIHLFTALQFTLLSLILAKALRPLFPERFFQILIPTFLGFAIIDAFFLNGLYNFNSFARPLASSILLFLALSFFYKTLKELKIKSLEREPLFWLCIGIVIYFSGSLLIFLLTNYVKTSNEVLRTLWGIHAIFNIILNTSYSIILWIKPTS